MSGFQSRSLAIDAPGACWDDSARPKERDLETGPSLIESNAFRHCKGLGLGSLVSLAREAGRIISLAALRLAWKLLLEFSYGG